MHSVSRNFIHWFCTRVQYGFLLHRNCFLLINDRKFHKISKISQDFKIKKKNWPLNFYFYNFEILKILTFYEISKKQFLCNKKTYCTLVPRNFIYWFCTRVQYDYALHRNCFLLINMLENGMSRVLLLANRKTVK